MSSSALTINPAEGVHEGVVAVAAVAGTEQVLDERLQPLVPQPAVEIGEELLLLVRADVVELVVRPRLLQQRDSTFPGWPGWSRRTRSSGSVAVAPEMLVVGSSLADVTETIGRDDEAELFGVHGDSCTPSRTRMARISSPRAVMWVPPWSSRRSTPLAMAGRPNLTRPPRYSVCGRHGLRPDLLPPDIQPAMAAGGLERKRNGLAKFWPIRSEPTR